MGVIWGKREAKYFWERGLDVTNQIDWVEEISFLAQRACGRKRCGRSDMGKQIAKAPDVAAFIRTIRADASSRR